MTMNGSGRLRKCGILLGWVVVWQCLSMWVGNGILLAGPGETLAAFLNNLLDGTFWLAVATSLLRIIGGFLLAFCCGVILGGISVRFPLMGEILHPVLTLMKAVPIASVVILLLFWSSSRALSTVVSFFVVFPMIYFSTRTGICTVDVKLLEMAQVFQLGTWRRIWYIYRPAVTPYLMSSCRTAIGMSWKSGIAAEVIGLPEHSIGERLYMAKIYLETGDLFAWTGTILLGAILTEQIFLRLLKKIGGVTYEAGEKTEHGAGDSFKRN
jgi:NitT/TauT family transport system permease protein